MQQSSGGGGAGFDPDVLVGWTLVRTQKAMAERFHTTFAEMGLTAHEFGVLVRLGRQPGASQAAMAREVYVTPQSMGPIVRRLVTAGLVRRSPPPHRGGAAHLELTPAGEVRVREAVALVTRGNEPEALGLDDEERETLNRLLHRLRRHLEAESGG